MLIVYSFDVIRQQSLVRAGVVESRVGTLAVALGVGLGNRCLVVTLACGFAVFLAFASKV